MSRLHADVDGAGPRLALVHGFTQTGRCWGPVAEDLRRDHELVLVDAPGHGRSSDVEADLAEAGRLVADVAGPATYLGYSMGGRIALHTALERPSVVRRLVLVGATAGIESETERSTRIAEDEARARRIEEIGVEAFIDEWLALPLFAGLDRSAACVGERLTNSVAGLASSLRHAGAGTQVPSWDRLHELDMPVLVVAGALDHKFVAIGERLTRGIGGNATFATVAQAGHTAHLERPDAFLALLRAWLAETAL